MAKIIEAIYENGVFRPLEKVDLKEGEKVRIIIGGIVRKTMGIIPSDRIQEIIEEIENEGSSLTQTSFSYHLAGTSQHHRSEAPQA